MIREHNPNWLQIPNHPYRILIVGASASGKTNTSWNLIRQQPDISKIYLYAKDLYEEKYQMSIHKHQGVYFKYHNVSKDFIKYWSDMDDIYKNIEEHKPDRKRKILIIFDDMIADMLRTKNFGKQ